MSISASYFYLEENKNITKIGSLQMISIIFTTSDYWRRPSVCISSFCRQNFEILNVLTWLDSISLYIWCDNSFKPRTSMAGRQFKLLTISSSESDQAYLWNDKSVKSDEARFSCWRAISLDQKLVKPVSAGATKADWLPVKNDQSLGVFFKSIKTSWETSWSSLRTDHRAFFSASLKCRVKL